MTSSAQPSHSDAAQGKPVASGMEMEVMVSSLAFGGQGVVRLDGLVVFVPDGIPGDRARVRIDRVRKRHAEATLVEVLEPSPDRRPPRCPHFGPCGGCRWQVIDYQSQLRYKHRQVQECLERLGGLRGFEMAPVRGMEDPWRYRNKVEFSVGTDEEGRTVVGFHPAGRWDVVLPIEQCLLVPDVMLSVRQEIEHWLQDQRLMPWNPRTRSGMVRHVTIRHSRAGGRILVGITTTAKELPGGVDLGRHLARAVPGFEGLTHAQVVEARETPTRRVSTTVWGQDRLTEIVDGLELEFSLDAFFQTNTAMTEVLYSIVEEAACLTGGETIWDLYCGTGSIALYLARKAASVLGIELIPAAIENARRNAALNGLRSARFLLGDARKVLKQLLEGKGALPPELARPHVVVLDPPRGGLAKKVVARVAAARPQRLVYVSCNPSTQAGDLALFAEAGYVLRRVTPVDMFPHTPHIEAVALLEPKG